MTDSLVAEFILDISSGSSNSLSEEQVAFGEKVFNQFLLSEDTSYAIVGGKSGFMLALGIYLSMLPVCEMEEKVDLVCEKIRSEQDIILSDSIYNEFEIGRAGMLFSMTYLIVLDSNNKLGEIFLSLLSSLIGDSIFYKKGVTWLSSDLCHDKVYYLNSSIGIYFVLRHINKVFKNEFLEILIDSIVIPGRRLKICKYDIDKFKVNQVFFENKTNHHVYDVSLWIEVFNQLLNSSVNEFGFDIKKYQLISKKDGFNKIIKNNFQEVFFNIEIYIFDEVIYKVSCSCQNINQYDIFSKMKLISWGNNIKLLKTLLRKLKLRSNFIDKSDIFYKKQEIGSDFYANLMPLDEMDKCSIFDYEIAVNQDGMNYLALKSNWLFGTNYKRNNFIGCFTVRRFDKTLFLSIDILDGFLPHLFLYLVDEGSTVNQFKRNVLDKTNISYNEFHLKNRILLLIKQGVFVVK